MVNGAIPFFLQPGVTICVDIPQAITYEKVEVAMSTKKKKRKPLTHDRIEIMFKHWQKSGNLSNTAMHFGYSRTYVHQLYVKWNWRERWATICQEAQQGNDEQSVADKISNLEKVEGLIEDAYTHLKKKFSMVKPTHRDLCALIEIQGKLRGALPAEELVDSVAVLRAIESYNAATPAEKETLLANVRSGLDQLAVSVE